MTELMKRYADSWKNFRCRAAWGSLCLVLLPLVWKLSSEGFWSDELSTLYYSRHLAEALRDEPHIPLFYFLVNIAESLFGDFSPMTRLVSVIPVLLSLIMLFKLGSRWKDELFGLSLVLVLTLNPVFLHFARSLRANSFLYTFPILLLFVLEFAQEKWMKWWIFFIFFLGGILHYGNVPALWFLLIAYLFAKKELALRLNLFIPAIAACFGVFLLGLVQYVNYMNHWPPSFHLLPSWETLDRFSRYYFTYAEETFSFDWKSWRYIDIHSQIMTMFLILTSALAFFRNRGLFKKQLLLILTSTSLLVLFWSLSFADLPSLSPRNHLAAFILVPLALGVGLNSPHMFRQRFLLIGIFSILSIWHLQNISFYKVQPEEVNALLWAKKHSQNKIVFLCHYPQKIKLFQIENATTDCRHSFVQSLIEKEKDFMVIEEFYNPEVPGLKNLLQQSGYKLKMKKQFHYSKIYIFTKS